MNDKRVVEPLNADTDVDLIELAELLAAELHARKKKGGGLT